MLCARALVRALNDAKNRAQQGCAMQFSGITLISQSSVKLKFYSLRAKVRNDHPVSLLYCKQAKYPSKINMPRYPAESRVGRCGLVA